MMGFGVYGICQRGYAMCEGRSFVGSLCVCGVRLFLRLFWVVGGEW